MACGEGLEVILSLIFASSAFKVVAVGRASDVLDPWVRRAAQTA